MLNNKRNYKLKNTHQPDHRTTKINNNSTSTSTSTGNNNSSIIRTVFYTSNRIKMASNNNYKLSEQHYSILVLCFIVYSLIGGYMAGIQPINQWRLFSYHPLLMTIGMIGHLGIAAITKKLGGYTNTKNHGLISWGGLMCSFMGMYAIYKNKENNNVQHLQSIHGQIGFGIMLCSIGLGLAGGIILHPDYGIDKTNTTIRLLHKTCSRLTLAVAWCNCIYGLYQMNVSILLLLSYALPLVLFTPYTLI